MCYIYEVFQRELDLSWKNAGKDEIHKISGKNAQKGAEPRVFHLFGELCGKEDQKERFLF